MKARHAKKLLKAQVMTLKQGDILAIAADPYLLGLSNIQRLNQGLDKWIGFHVPIMILPCDQFAVIRGAHSKISMGHDSPLTKDAPVQ